MTKFPRPASTTGMFASLFLLLRFGHQFISCCNIALLRIVRLQPDIVLFFISSICGVVFGPKKCCLVYEAMNDTIVIYW